MHKLMLALSTVCLLFTLNQPAQAPVSSPSQFNPGTSVAKLAEQAPVHWVSMAQIRNNLTGHLPMAAGSDTGDTTLFSGPDFWRGKKTYPPDSEDYPKDPVFWEKMNNGWGEFSIPEEVACQLIDMHVRRSDSILLVTECNQTKAETVSGTLSDNLHIPAGNMNPVIFAGNGPSQSTRAQWLWDKNIHVSYDDSNNDITATHGVGIRGIRTLRVFSSTYRPLPQADAFGEGVIVNSGYWGRWLRITVFLSKFTLLAFTFCGLAAH